MGPANEAFKHDRPTPLALWPNPLPPRNEEKLELKLSFEQIEKTSTFGDLPYIWFKSAWGLSNVHRKAPDGWPEEYWQKDSDGRPLVIPT